MNKLVIVVIIAIIVIGIGIGASTQFTEKNSTENTVTENEDEPKNFVVGLDESVGISSP